MTDKTQFSVCVPEVYSKGFQGETGTRFHRIGTAWMNEATETRGRAITVKIGVPVSGLKELVLFEDDKAARDAESATVAPFGGNGGQTAA